MKEEWQSDGSWIGLLEIPAGMQDDFLERLQKKAKGNADVRILDG
jgi:ribosome maturation protein SDO1